MSLSWINRVASRVKESWMSPKTYDCAICDRLGETFCSPEIFLDEMIFKDTTEYILLCELDEELELIDYQGYPGEDFFFNLDYTIFNSKTFKKLSYVTRTNDRKGFLFEDNQGKVSYCLVILEAQELKQLNRQKTLKEQTRLIAQIIRELTQQDNWVTEW